MSTNKKYRYKKNGQSYIENYIKFPEIVQERTLQKINSNYYINLLKLDIKKQKKKKAILSCTVENLTPLNIYLKNLMQERNYFIILLKIIDVIKSCKEYGLNDNNIELNAKAVCVEPNLMTIKCIYWPVVNNNSYSDKKEFFKNLINYTSFNEQNCNWLRQYNLFFNDIAPFSINAFEKLILELMGKKVHTKEISPSSKLLTSNFSLPNENDDNCTINKNNVYNPLDARKNSSRTVRNFRKTATTNLQSLSSQLVDTAQLTRKLNNRSQRIKKPIFKIGKATRGMDCCVVDNPAISRFHAQIVMQNGAFYIIDNNSTNGTFVNGRRIPPQQKVRINNGDIIKLANEEFIFGS